MGCQLSTSNSAISSKSSSAFSSASYSASYSDSKSYPLPPKHFGGASVAPTSKEEQSVKSSNVIAFVVDEEKKKPLDASSGGETVTGLATASIINQSRQLAAAIRSLFLSASSTSLSSASSTISDSSYEVGQKKRHLRRRQSVESISVASLQTNKSMLSLTLPSLEEPATNFECLTKLDGVTIDTSRARSNSHVVSMCAKRLNMIEVRTQFLIEKYFFLHPKKHILVYGDSRRWPTLRYLLA